MTEKPGQFIWYELMTKDIDAAAKFYGAVIGWTVGGGDPVATGIDYRHWDIGGETIGGLMEIPQEAAAHGMRPIWLGYVSVPDVDKAILEIKAAGGEIHMPPMDIPGTGRFAMVSDPQGAAFYVMTPIGTGPSTSYAMGRTGHGGWNELHSSDGAAAIEFYKSQFGWEQSAALDMGPMGAYRLFNTGGEAVGGMMTSNGYGRPLWLYYFMVEEINAAKARVEAAGGAILNGPHEVPGGAWIIQGRDPQGAAFALVGPNASVAR